MNEHTPGPWTPHEGGRISTPTMFKVVEKKNPNAVHCITHTRERAEHWITVTAPKYCLMGYFMDKTLTPDSFTIKEF